MTKYDKTGVGYSNHRKDDPRIEEQLHTHLAGATNLLNIGTGKGSCEPKQMDLVAVEPSAEMIRQRSVHAHPVVQASAEKLPFEDKSFSHAMSILSMHHWTNRQQAFSEIKRVTREKFVAISWNPEAEPFWLTADYFPEIYQKDLDIFPCIKELRTNFKNVEIHPLLIHYDCKDGFLAAYWRRPEAYLDLAVRTAISTFSKLFNLDHGLTKLDSDLKNGQWQIKNKALLNTEWIDAGYILILADI